MVRIFKRLAWSSVAILLLMIAVILVVPAYVDVNDYKDRIATEASARIGRTVAIDGNISLSLFPWIGFEVKGIRMANAPGFGPSPFAAVERAGVHLKLLPLFRGSVVMDTLVIDGLKIDLAIDESGRSNWEDLIPAAAAPAPVVAAPVQGKAPVLSLAALAIGGVEIERARLSWSDRRTSEHYLLAPLNIHSGAIAPGRPVDITLDLVLDSTQPKALAEIALKTRLMVDSSFEHVEFDAMKLHVDGRLDQPAITAILDAGGRLSYDRSRDRLVFKDGHMTGRLAGAAIPGTEMPFEIDSNVVADLGNRSVELHPFEAHIFDIEAHAQARLDYAAGVPRYDGKIEIATFDMRELLSRLAIALPAMADPGTMRNVAISTQVEGQGGQIALRKLVLDIDDSHLTGELALSQPSRPKIRFDLVLDEIDLDRYLPPASTGQKTIASPAAGGAAVATRQPSDLLQRLDVDGRLGIGQIKAARLRAEDIRLGLVAHHGVIEFRPLQARLYGGSYNGGGRLDVHRTPAVLSIDEHLAHIDIGAMATDLLGKRLAYGQGDIDVRLQAQGEDDTALLASLAGTLKIVIESGGIPGIALTDLIEHSELGKGLDLAALRQQDQTVFRRFGATARVENGVLRTDDMRLDSAQFVAQGQGQIDLPHRSVDMTVTIEPRKMFARLLGDLGGLTIPVRIEGALSTPTYGIDTKALLDAQLEVQRRRLQHRLEGKGRKGLEQTKRSIKNKAQEQIDKQKKRLEHKLREGLKGLF